MESEEVDFQISPSALDDEFGAEKLFFEFTRKAYEDFLVGQDDFEYINSELTELFGNINL